jgi:hypothetical protein
VLVSIHSLRNTLLYATTSYLASFPRSSSSPSFLSGLSVFQNDALFACSVLSLAPRVLR